jgi:hypothetical protein
LANIIREMGRACGTPVEGEKCMHNFFVRKPEGNGPPGRPWHGLKDISLYLKGCCDWGRLDLTDLIGPVTGSHEHHNESLGSIKCRKFVDHPPSYLRQGRYIKLHTRMLAVYTNRFYEHGTKTVS